MSDGNPMFDGLHLLKRFKGVGYIASPFTDDSDKKSEIEFQRYDAAKQMCSLLMMGGLDIFSPIVYGYHIYLDNQHIGGDALYWQTFNSWILDRCPYLLMLMMEGWDKSEGVQAEFTQAWEMGKPCFNVRVSAGMPAVIIEEIDKKRVITGADKVIRLYN